MRRRKIPFTCQVCVVSFWSFMKRSHRHITSLFLTTVYLLVIFSPLASLAFQSHLTGHKVAGECSGDCSVDHCSLERSAAHSCCCWKKKQLESTDAHRHAETVTAPTHHVQMTEAPKKKGSCCDEPAEENREEGSMSPAEPAPSSQNKRITTISSSSCGDGTPFVLSNFEGSYHIPYFFSETYPVSDQQPQFSTTPDRLTSRFCDPPEQPPQAQLIS